jgi:hypothetical protein
MADAPEVKRKVRGPASGRPAVARAGGGEPAFAGAGGDARSKRVRACARERRRSSRGPSSCTRRSPRWSSTTRCAGARAASANGRPAAGSRARACAAASRGLRGRRACGAPEKPPLACRLPVPSKVQDVVVSTQEVAASSVASKKWALFGFRRGESGGGWERCVAGGLPARGLCLRHQAPAPARRLALNRITVRSLEPATDIAALAEEIVDKCKLIHPTKVGRSH